LLENLVILFIAGIASAANPPDTIPTCESEGPKQNKTLFLQLRSYETNKFGWTDVHSQEYNESYLDFLISIQCQIVGRLYENILVPDLNLSFSGQFAQHIDRNSRPVIGRRYNPKLFLRFGSDTSVFSANIGYAHESNGQSLSDSAKYSELMSDNSQKSNAASVEETISRGWDYIDIIAIRNFENAKLSFNARYYLDGGLLQNRAENRNSWEIYGKNISRKYIDDAIIELELKNSLPWSYFHGKIQHNALILKGAMGLTLGNWPKPGYFEVEEHLQLFLPVYLNMHRGYLSSVAGYSILSWSFGAGLYLDSF